MMNVFGIAGPAGVGKTELAEAFRRRGYAIAAFADPVKVIARDVWGCDPGDLWGPSGRRTGRVPGVPGLTVRTLLQKIGSAGRAIDEGCWVRAMRRRISTEAALRYPARGTRDNAGTVWGSETFQGFVIPDVRFDNEAALVHEFCGAVFALVREGRTTLVEGADHESEQGVSDACIDHEITMTTVPSAHVSHLYDDKVLYLTRAYGGSP